MPIFSFFLFACFAKNAGIETISRIAPLTPFLKAPPTCGWTPGSDAASVLTLMVTNEHLNDFCLMNILNVKTLMVTNED